MKTVEDKLDKILEDITGLKVDMAETKVTLDRNTDSLEIHMKRSDAIEAKLEQDYQKLVEEIDPIKKHVQLIKNIFWFVGALGATLLGLKELGLLSLLL
jgi:phosphoglucomutase